MANSKTIGFKNVGISDRVFRILLGLVFMMFYITGVAEGTFGTIILVIGAILLLTAIIRICPAYLILGISTCKLDKASRRKR